MDAVWILSGKILVASPPITQRLSAPVKSFRGGKEKAKRRLIMQCSWRDYIKQNSTQVLEMTIKSASIALE